MSQRKSFDSWLTISNLFFLGSIGNEELEEFAHDHVCVNWRPVLL